MLEPDAQLSNRLGQFRLLAKLGKGGMADVFVCVRDEASSLGRLMVIKLLREDLASDPEAVSMFLDEARLSSRLHHPNVIQIYEAGITDGRHAILMEYLNGVSLAELRRAATQQRRAMPLRITVRILGDALRGLHHAHELCDGDGEALGLVHRDFTATNVFTTVDGQTVVLDFGIAKARDRSSQTRAGMLKGTGRYVAPESILGKPVDRRADVYAAGVLLWELITGQKYWRGLDYVAILQKTAGGHRAPWPEGRELPARLCEVAERALAHDPKDRYQTADELRFALKEAVQDGEGCAEVEEVGEYIAELVGAECAERQRRCLQLAESNTDQTLDPAAFPTFSQGEGSSSHASAAALVQPLPAPASSRWLVLGLVAVALIAIASAGVVLFRGGAEAPPPVATAPSVTRPEARPAEDDHVRLVAAVSPPEATLYLDDRMLPGNPANVRVPADDGEHTLRAVLPGYESAAQVVDLRSDVAVTLSLRPLAPTAERAPVRRAASEATPTQMARSRSTSMVRPATAVEAGEVSPPTETMETPNRGLIERPRATGARMLDEVNPWAE